jgi:protein phosphatase
MGQSLELMIGAKSDVGMKRSNNEDSFMVLPQFHLCVLSDGMGGQAAGEVASKMAVDTISGCIKEVALHNGKVAFGDPDPRVSEATNTLASAVRLSNRAIWEAAQKHASAHGMGATVDAAWLRGPVMSLAHVGDSRVYLIRNGDIQQVTNDHSLVMEQVRRGLLTKEEAESSERKNLLMRALGAEEKVDVDLDEIFLMPGDTIVMCSDGLSNMVPDDGIAQIVGEADTPQHAAERLVEVANDNGGMDNITVIVVRVTEGKPRGLWALLKSLFVG